MISVNHVTRAFGRHRAVDDVTLAVQPGESVALWGKNGAGKSTLIRCVLGLLRFRGEIVVGGCNVLRAGKAARLLIGYVPQELGFYDELGVGEAVVFFAQLKGLRRVSTRETLGRVGLADHASKRVRELSGGMKQRLALAIALLGDPPVLVLDEVTASLDAVGREDFVRLLQGLSGSGRTMLFASHRVEEVAAMAHRVVTMEKGRLTRVESCADFVSSVRHSAVLHLVIDQSARQNAMDSLELRGFAPRLNGVGVLVPVPPDQKAAPFQVLAEARIRVDDFEVVTLARAAAMASHAEASAPASSDPVPSPASPEAQP